MLFFLLSYSISKFTNMEIAAIRELLRQGETGKALAALIVYLERDRRFKGNFLRTLRVMEASYNAVRQKELKGILPFADAQRKYNETNDALLAILDDLEAGRIPDEALNSTRRTVLLAMIGGAVLVLAVFVLWRVLNKKAIACPEFAQKQALHILIVPFDPLSSLQSPVEKRIQGSINELTGKARIPVEIAIGKRSLKDDRSSLTQADNIGRRCGDIDLVLFGTYNAYAADSIRVNFGYSFLKAGGRKGNVPFQTFRDITAVEAPRDLEDALHSICGMIALDKGKLTFAKQWMEKIQEKNLQEVKMTEWLAKQAGN